MSYTPGPWKWEFLGTAGNYFLVGSNGQVTNSGPNSDDGKLKEAAPDLLEALESLVADYGDYAYLPPNKNYDKAKAAIAKARGENG